MGVFDRAAKHAAKADPEAVVGRLLAGSGPGLTFAGWFDTVGLPRHASPGRTPDLIAELAGPAGRLSG